MAVVDRIHNNWPETDALLTAKRPTEYDAARTAAICYVIDALWATYRPGVTPPASVDAESEVVQQHVADQATLRLVRFARDVYAQLKRSRSINYPQGGAGTEVEEDKQAMLDRLVADLTTDIAGREARVRTILHLPATVQAPSDVPAVVGVVIGAVPAALRRA